MSFDKQLKSMIEDIDVPDELSPANIAAMLRASGVKPMVSENKNTSSGATRPVMITARKTNRSVIMRTLAAAAACLALAGGFVAYKEQVSKPVEIESEIEYKAVQVESYDELYNIYTGIYLKNSENVGAENGDGVEIKTEETAISVEPLPDQTVTTPAITEVAPPAETDKQSAESIEAVRSDFSDADIVKSDDSSIYYICGGTLYVVSKTDMAVTAEITADYAPFEMYIRGSSLVLVGEENASVQVSEEGAGGKNVVVDIYSINDGSPRHITTYKQNGSYTSARIDDNGVLYLVTGYSDYRVNPLDETAELDNYVPAYYVNGEKRFVAAEDITVPQDANNTDYTVISSVNCNDPENSISVKAVLGSSANAYCSEDTLYIAFTSFKDGKDYTAVTSFALSESGLAYKASAVLEGELISRYSMNKNGNIFRIACRSYDENGMIVTNIYSLDDGLNVGAKAGNLLPGVIIGTVKFDGNYASLIERDKTEPVQVVDLTQSAPVETSQANSFLAPYVNRFSDTCMTGISAEENPDGSLSALKLEMYSSDEGNKIDEIVFAEFNKVNSPALTDKKAMLVDTESGIIGIPVSSVNEFGVKNQYYVFSYNEENGFTERGVIEYNDIDDSYTFERAMVNGENLFIIGSGRVVSVNLTDMTVMETFDFQ